MIFWGTTAVSHHNVNFIRGNQDAAAKAKQATRPVHSCAYLHAKRREDHKSVNYCKTILMFSQDGTVELVESSKYGVFCDFMANMGVFSGKNTCE